MVELWSSLSHCRCDSILGRSSTQVLQDVEDVKLSEKSQSGKSLACSSSPNERSVLMEFNHLSNSMVLPRSGRDPKSICMHTKVSSGATRMAYHCYGSAQRVLTRRSRCRAHCLRKLSTLRSHRSRRRAHFLHISAVPRVPPRLTTSNISESSLQRTRHAKLRFYQAHTRSMGTRITITMILQGETPGGLTC